MKIFQKKKEKKKKGLYTLMHYVRTLSFTSNFFPVIRKPSNDALTFYLQIN